MDDIIVYFIVHTPLKPPIFLKFAGLLGLFSSDGLSRRRTLSYSAPAPQWAGEGENPFPTTTRLLPSYFYKSQYRNDLG